MMHSNMKQIATLSGHARKIMRILWNCEIFHYRFGPGLRDDVAALIL